MSKSYRFIFLLSCCFSLGAAAATPDPALIAKKAVDNYFTIIRDPSIARGNYGELFKLKQLSGMSAADRGWVTRSLIRHGVKDNIKWSLSGSVLKLSLPQIKTGMLEIDFRDVVKGPDRVLYFNGKKYVSRYLAQRSGDQRFSVRDELGALQKFFTTTQLGMHPWLYDAIKVAMFPLALLAGCDDGDVDANAASAALATEGVRQATYAEAPRLGEGSGPGHLGAGLSPGAEDVAAVQLPDRKYLEKAEAKEAEEKQRLAQVAATAAPVAACKEPAADKAPYELKPEDLEPFKKHSAHFEFDGAELAFDKPAPAEFTEWGQGEDFPSLGLGHYIWYPEGTPKEAKKFEESFPQYIEFMLKNCNIAIPADLQDTSHKQVILKIEGGKLINGAPWKEKLSADGKEGFDVLKKIPTSGASSLTKFLWTKENTDCQAKFQQKRLADAIAAMRAKPTNPGMCSLIDGFMHDRNSYLAMLDYVNFKGDGNNPQKDFYVHKDKGTIQWGLKQVIESVVPGLNKNIQPPPCGPDGTSVDAHTCFAKAAEATLKYRAENAMRFVNNEWVASPEDKTTFLGYLKRPAAEEKDKDGKSVQPGGWARRLDKYAPGI